MLILETYTARIAKCKTIIVHSRNTRIRVVNLGSILAQRSVIDIEKSTDNDY